MIVCLSSSSPQVSIAIFDASGTVIAAAARQAPSAAGRAIVELLEESLQTHNLRLQEATGFVADVGPGSFIGTRVAVIMAKAYAFQFGVRCAGVSAFDLIDRSGTVIIPSRKGEFFVREPGNVPFRTTELPSGAFYGYGVAEREPTFPTASQATSLIDELQWVDPAALIPQPLVEPSISQPKASKGAL